MANNSTNAAPGNTLHPVVHIVTGFLAFETLVIIVTNSLVFLLFTKCKKLRRKSNYCLVSLAVSDFLAGVVVFPMFVVANYTRSKKSKVSFDAMHRFLAYSTILHLLFATIDRCFKISYPFRYRTFLTKNRIIVTLLLIWSISLGVALAKIPYMFDKARNEAYSVTVLVVMGCIPFAIILALNVYTRMLITNRNKNASNLVETDEKSKKKQKQQHVVLLYLTMAVLTFLLGFLSYLLAGLVALPLWIQALIAVLKYCTHFVNPLLYTFFKADFRKAFNEVIAGKKERQQRSSFSTESKITRI